MILLKDYLTRTCVALNCNTITRGCDISPQASRRGDLPQQAKERLWLEAPATFLKQLLILSLTATSAFAQIESSKDLESLPRVAPVVPEEAVETFQILDGFRLELLAAEPLVTDPVAMQYDENGLAYVVEMNDYPYTDTALDVAWIEQTSKPIGRIRVLEDTDGDGRFDQSTVFAEGLSWPTGVACWNGGVFVTATPDVWYLKDTDGDRRADVRRKVLTGFRKFNVQAVMNNLAWGLDHKIYAAGASNGGEIRPGENGSEETVRLGRNDFRIDPVTEAFEVLSGGARFGNTFDDFGNRFICNIRNPVQHVVLKQRYLARNRHLPVQQAVQDAAVAGDAIEVFRKSPPEPWRVLNAARLASDKSKNSPRSEMAATGYVTSSSGITIYRGAAYPPEYYGNAFVCEVAGNLVMRYRLQEDGPTFIARRATTGEDFLASTDNWCRPVNFVNAPDGTLHMLDMYRETIEHPWSIPDDIKARLDLESGRDRGRIFRLAPPAYPPNHQANRRPQLGSASTEQLVAELENPNCWWRETAHRLIYQRQEAPALEPLKNMMRERKNPLARLHALWSLQGLEALEPDDLLVGLADTSSQVREHAVLLSEHQLNESSVILDHVLAVANDEDFRVRFQVALSLGEYAGPRQKEVNNALANVLKRDGQNEWMRIAVGSSAAGREGELLKLILADGDFSESNTSSETIAMLAEIVGARGQQEQVVETLAALDQTSPDVQIDAVSALGKGLKRAKQNLHDYASAKNAKSGQFLKGMFDQALRVAGDNSEPPPVRLRWLQLLKHMDLAQTQPVLQGLLDSQQPHSVQVTAIEVLGESVDASVADMLLDAYPRLTPAVRSEIVAAMLSRAERTAPLLAAIEAGRVAKTEISITQRNLLVKSRNDAIRQRAAALFADDAPSPRSEVIARYQQSLDMSADPVRGQKVFLRECTTCHRLGNQGHDVGENLSTIKNRTAAEILVHVLDPNREVSPNFFEYIVATDDGRTRTGVIAAETATSITLRRGEGKQETILRDSIEELTSSGVSLMPEGLEKKISPAEMADLLAFLVDTK